MMDIAQPEVWMTRKFLIASRGQNENGGREGRRHS
jgi:hypothetical protein